MHHELATLRKNMVTRKETRDEIILNGNVGDFSEYKSVVGQRTGLVLAIQEIDDLLEKLETNND